MNCLNSEAPSQRRSLCSLYSHHSSDETGKYQKIAQFVLRLILNGFLYVLCFVWGRSMKSNPTSANVNGNVKLAGMDGGKQPGRCLSQERRLHGATELAAAVSRYNILNTPQNWAQPRSCALGMSPHLGETDDLSFGSQGKTEGQNSDAGHIFSSCRCWCVSLPSDGLLFI